jgi:hypothetical protein
VARIGMVTAIAATVATGVGTTMTTSVASAVGTGVTSNSITIGATVPLTGPAAPGYDEIAPATNAVFDWINAHGGVFGRKVHFDYMDDGYNPANTATLTRKLVLQDNVLGTVGSLGTPTQAAVEPYLNALHIPQVFVESGCNCWSEPKYPYTTGWQPPYTVDGKILGSYIAAHFAGQKVGYLTQDDEFGQDVVKGLDMEIPSSAVVSRQTYNVATLAGPLTTQISALQSAGAKVVVLATIPAATALSLLPAAIIGYHPQWVIDAVGADPPTVGPLLSSFTTKGGGSAAQATAAVGLLNGVVTNSYLPAESDAANPWIKVTKKLLQDYAPSLWSKYGLDGNTEYGVALGLTYVQALLAAGRNLTRQSLVNAIAKSGRHFATPGLVPLAYSSSVHYGYLGDQVVQISSTATPITTPTGTFPGVTPLSPVYVTSAGKGPVKVYKGKASLPPRTVTRTA